MPEPLLSDTFSYNHGRATPAYYFTAVTHDRLPIIRTDILKRVLCGAWAEVRQNHGILILAYVIMLDHAQHSVWHHHTDSLEIFGEDTFRQKVEYIHQNPVHAGLCARAEEYRFSSARQWDGKELDDGPLLTDHRSINWR